MVFFTVDDPNSTSHRSMARSMSPAASMPTGRCPTAGRTLSRIPAEYVLSGRGDYSEAAVQDLLDFAGKTDRGSEVGKLVERVVEMVSPSG